MLKSMGLRKEVHSKKEADFATARLAAIIFAGIMILPNIGTIEGRLFPVVGPVTLGQSKLTPPPEYRAEWAASADKYRSCSEFVRIEWWLGKRGGDRVLVAAKFLDAPEIRSVGRLEWSRLQIDLPPDETLQNSHSDVLHDCGWPWLTRTRFFN